jgi:hypothetical protein
MEGCLGEKIDGHCGALEQDVAEVEERMVSLEMLRCSARRHSMLRWRNSSVASSSR